MKSHIKNFLDYHGISGFIACAVCGNEATDIHHISGRPMGNKSKRYDVPENLIPLCRDCHSKTHNEKISKQECKEFLYRWSIKNGTPIKWETILNFK
jgi:5-methylcytosine-specific restriction endonuclease McrA